jgi:hypothetical protein
LSNVPLDLLSKGKADLALCAVADRASKVKLVLQK